VTDLAKTIAPKSDQLNADDLIAGPRTITITGVRGCDDEQPIAIHFEGGEKTPYKPCKSMRRVLVHCWGPDGNTYVGKRMTLYCDPNVLFGGIKVGGIRISHLSHIDREMVLPLTVTRAKRAPYTVKPLRAEVKAGPQTSRGADDRGASRDDDFPGDRGAPPRGAQSQTGELSLSQRADAYERRIREAPSTVKLKAIRAAGEGLRADLERGDPERGVELEQLWEARFADHEEAERSGS